MYIHKYIYTYIYIYIQTITLQCHCSGLNGVGHAVLDKWAPPD